MPQYRFGALLERSIDEGSLPLHSQPLVSNRHTQVQFEHWSKVIGGEFTSMLVSRERTATYVKSEDPNVRRAAMYLLSDYWQPDAATAALFENIASNDPDNSVRIGAISHLGHFYERTNDQRVGQFFSRLVCCEREPSEVRKAAYFQLFVVRGRRIFFFHNPFEFQFPNEVDWSLVESFLNPPAHGTEVEDYPFGSHLSPTERAFVDAAKRGRDALLSGRYQEAVDLLTVAIRNSETAGVFYMRGCAYGNLGKYDAAVSDFTKATELNPNYAFAYYERGKAHQLLNSPELSAADLAKAASLNPVLHGKEKTG